MNGTWCLGQTVPINGMDMYYEVCGEREPLVLLHGWTGSGADWGLIFKDSPKGFRLMVPDLRGHGRSTNPSHTFTHRQSALDVFALLDGLGVSQFRAIGMSLGAKTLLHMATQQPSRIEAMVLVSAAHYFPEQARAFMRTMSPDNRTAEEWQVMRQRHRHGDEQIRALWRQGHAFKDSYDDMNFTLPYLSTITARTLIIHGDRDPLYPVHIPLEMHTAIPISYLWIIPNGGHGPIFGELTGRGEMSSRFAATAIGFLHGEWERAGRPD